MAETGQAVLVGALASGVNRETWTAFRNVMLALFLALALQITIVWHATGSSDLLLHVLLLTALAGALFLLLKWFISHTGLVTLQQQMTELNTSKAE